MTTNRYGLDTDYISRNLSILQRDMSNYRPDEMRRALTRLAGTCEEKAKCPSCGSEKKEGDDREF